MNSTPHDIGSLWVHPRAIGLVITKCVGDGGATRSHGISRDKASDTMLSKKKNCESL